MNIIIPIIVGSIIGYITNWLAIKMLFRPYRKKSIFGISIPFTPGLIPKELDRIAKSVGDAVGEHLLSPTVITGALSSKVVNDRVNLWIKDEYFSLKNKEESIVELLKVEDMDNFNQIIDLLSESITRFLLDEIETEKFKEMITNYIELNIYEGYKDTVVTTIKTKGNEYLNKLLNSDDTKSFIDKILLNKIEELNTDERYLSEIISNETLYIINDILEKNKYVIGESIKEAFKDPDINKRFTKSISEFVNQNISRVITMFISPEQISEKVLHVVEKYINDPNSNDDYIMLINNAINKLMGSKISSIVYNLRPLINEEQISNLSCTIQRSISEEMISELIFNIEKKFLESEQEIKQYILNNISNNLDSLFISTSFREGISTFIRGSIDSITNKPISSVLEKLDEETISTTIVLLKSIFDTFAKNELPKVIEFFNVSSIVEKQINSFEVEYTEKLILDIANKELKAITWLGALLGAIMGMLTPLLQML